MRAWHVAAGVAALLLVAVPYGLDSCGMGPTTLVFATSQRPADINQFLAGKLGVLQRTYHQRYLIGAFRILSGKPLTEAEAQTWYPPPPRSGVPPVPEVGFDAWIDARKAVAALGEAPQIQMGKTVNTNGLLYSFWNCQEDAFYIAATTLGDLWNNWGADDPRTLDWTRGQDQVFANCAGDKPTIPPSPAAGMDPLLAAHRRYQIAAAMFYSGQYRKASQAFQEIAEDGESPWHESAPYLAARALLRAGMFDGDLAAYREGKDRLLAILNDPAQAEWHEASLGLLHLWQLRVEPRARLVELGQELAEPNEDDSLQSLQSVIDFLTVVNHPRDATGRPWSPAELAEVESSSELAAWMFAFSAKPPADSAEQSVNWWRKTHNPAWLIAGLANAPEAALPELLQAAGRVSPSAPAYESVTYYAVSRELRSGRTAAARNWADQALSRNLTTSSRNLILALRTQMARDFSEFLRFGLRRPESSILKEEGAEVESGGPAAAPTRMPPVFDPQMVADFNAQVPLALWVDASANTRLPPEMQLRVALVGWVRAVVLKRDEEARHLLDRVVEIQPATAEVARRFLSAADAEDARFAALFIILRSPELRPTLWFKTANLTAPHYSATDAFGDRDGCWLYTQSEIQPQPPAFLTPAERAAGDAEWNEIRAAEPWDATWLIRQTLDWAGKHPEDPRVPEALHRAVMASRWRCGDQDTGKYSRQAFTLLHRQYPQSEWTRKTPYWYN